ncbi:MAG: DUF5615 family PIN-like protein [Burkholderiales bacterium]
MRFLADMGISPRVVEWLRSRGHDVAHLGEQGLQRLADADVFTKAQQEQRILLTFDLDFGEIVALTGARMTSVIVFRLADARAQTVIARLATVLDRSAAALERGAVAVVETARHRVRRLPIENA